MQRERLNFPHSPSVCAQHVERSALIEEGGCSRGMRECLK